jgi:type IV secretion system protein TrbL
MFQLFPDKTDPYRFMSRALAATLSLFIVNPPGPGNTLFGKGLFAWAFAVSNAAVTAFLTGVDLSVTSANPSGVGSFIMLILGILLSVVVVGTELVCLSF